LECGDFVMTLCCLVCFLILWCIWMITLLFCWFSVVKYRQTDVWDDLLVRGSCFFCYFLQEREVLFSGKLGKESCSNANDVTEVFNKDHGGDNVGAMLQGEIERCPNVGMNLECKTKLRRRFFYHVALS